MSESDMLIVSIKPVPDDTEDLTIPFLTADEVKHCQTIKTIDTHLDRTSLAIIDRLVRKLVELDRANPSA